MARFQIDAGTEEAISLRASDSSSSAKFSYFSIFESLTVTLKKYAWTNAIPTENVRNVTRMNVDGLLVKPFSPHSMPISPYILHSAHLAVFQPHLDAVGMSRRLGQNICDDARSEATCSLVFFQHNLYLRSHGDISSFGSAHASIEMTCPLNSALSPGRIFLRFWVSTTAFTITIPS